MSNGDAAIPRRSLNGPNGIDGPIFPWTGAPSPYNASLTPATAQGSSGIITSGTVTYPSTGSPIAGTILIGTPPAASPYVKAGEAGPGYASPGYLDF